MRSHRTAYTKKKGVGPCRPIYTNNKIISIMAQRQMQRLLALHNDRSLARHRVEGIAIGKQLGTGSYGSVEEVSLISTL